MFTPETTFHMIARHLLAQNQCSERDEQCLYRGPNGLQCAVGCLIPDPEYRPGFDDFEVPEFQNLREVREACPTLQLHDFDTLDEMQDLHDTIAVENWEASLEDYADEKGYAWPPPVVALACVEAT